MPKEELVALLLVSGGEHKCGICRKDARGYLMDDPRFISSLISVTLCLWC
jgi:hypothetical protein